MRPICRSSLRSLLRSVAVALFLSWSPRADAQCLEWSRAFAPSGLGGSVEALHLDTSGPTPKLYVGGYFSNVGDVVAEGIAVFDGTTWSPLGPGPQHSVTHLATLDDGSGPVVFASGNGTLTRWDGTAWQDLGVQDGVIYGLQVFDDGAGPALFMGGYDLRVAGVGRGTLFRYDGAWSNVEGSLGDPGARSVGAFAVHDDGSGERLYIGGRFDDLGGSGARLLATWDGTTLAPAGPPGGLPPGSAGNLSVLSLASARRGGSNVLHVGMSSPVQTANGPSTWLFEGAGSWVGLPVTESVWGFTVQTATGPADPVWALVDDTLIELDGTLQPPVVLPGALPWSTSLQWFPGASGDLIWAGGRHGVVDDSSLAAWNGTAWELPGRGGGAPFSILAMGLHNFGNGPEMALVAANFGSRYFYRYDGSAFIRQPDPPGPDQIRGDGVVSHRGDLYITSSGVGFSSGAPVVRFDGTTWEYLGSGLSYDETVHALTSIDLGSGPELYLGGNFAGFNQAGTNGIARLDGTSFASVGGGLTNASFFDAIYTIEGWDDGQGADLYAGGNFSNIGGTAALNVARWDGSQWHALPGSLENSSTSSSAPVVRELTSAEVGGERRLFASGYFDRVNGLPSPGLASFDGTEWAPVTGGAADPIRLVGTTFNMVAHDPDGAGERIFVYGEFETPSGASFDLGMWDGTSWTLAPGAMQNQATFFNPSEGLSADLGRGRALYIAGSFSVLAGVTAGNFARLDEVCSAQVGMPYCTSFAGASGLPALCRASGSSSLSANALQLHLSDAPPASFALFALGTEKQLGTVGSGALCIGGTLERILPPGLTDSTGSLTLPLDFGAPYAAAASAGSSLHAQAFFRDTGPLGSILGTSDALEIALVP